MNRYHGAKRSLAGRGSRWIATIGFGLAIAVTVTLALAGQRYAAVARARAWTTAGPPCPLVSTQTFRASGVRPAEAFEFEGVRFARGYGYANCANITDDLRWGVSESPVCQFNNPSALDVATARGHFLFLTGAKAATIVVVKGAPRCVLRVRLEPDWLRR